MCTKEPGDVQCKLVSCPLCYSKITCRRLNDGELLFMHGDSRHPSAAFLHPFLSLSQAMCQNLEDLHVSGPLKNMNFSIPEGGGVRVIYQVIKCLLVSTLVKNHDLHTVTSQAVLSSVRVGRTVP